jgi:hypothetical protein
MTWAAEWVGNGIKRHLPTFAERLLETVESWVGEFSYERQFWSRVAGAPNVALIKAKSTDPDLLSSADPRLAEFDLAFIDGDHSYPAICSDLRNWASRVRVGGRVLVHDAGPAFKGVCRALHEWSQRSPIAVHWPQRDALCVVEVLGRLAPRVLPEAARNRAMWGGVTPALARARRAG